ncbi:MAG: ADP-glyceromanno-heptose 6-epimerase [Saprospiraceae bacterium]
MPQDQRIVITGAGGFIGSCLVQFLNENGFENLVLVDAFDPVKMDNIIDKAYDTIIDRDAFFEWFANFGEEIDFVFHIGARTDTTEQSTEIFESLNIQYSKDVWKYCTQFEIPLVYASSAATYGIGEQGFDDEADIKHLKPLNPYGWSKQLFDLWVIEQEEQPPFWAGLKFFNVYGPNESHKGRMASVIFHTYNQILKTGGMKLFASIRPEMEDGHQQRDFIYVKDIVSVCFWLMQSKPQSGIYNLGTGIARTFLDLATQTFVQMNLTPNISFIPTPEDIRNAYQDYTCASMAKLQNAGYSQAFYSLESGIEDYVKNYLIPNRMW